MIKSHRFATKDFILSSSAFVIFFSSGNISNLMSGRHSAAARNTASLHSSVTKITSWPSPSAVLHKLIAPGGPSVSVGGDWSTQHGNPERTNTDDFGGREQNTFAAR